MLTVVQLVRKGVKERRLHLQETGGWKDTLCREVIKSYKMLPAPLTVPEFRKLESGDKSTCVACRRAAVSQDWR